MILCPLPYNTLVQLKNMDKCHGASSVGTVARAELSVVGVSRGEQCWDRGSCRAVRCWSLSSTGGVRGLQGQ